MIPVNQKNLASEDIQKKVKDELKALCDKYGVKLVIPNPQLLIISDQPNESEKTKENQSSSEGKAKSE